MSRDYVQHGHRHAVDGSDPIPAAAAAGGDYVFAPSQMAELFALSVGRDQVGINSVWIDNTIGLPGGAYLNNWHENAYGSSGTSVAANGDLVRFRFALGPTGSTWALVLGFLNGSDFGKLDVRLASVPLYTTAGTMARYSDLSWIANYGSPTDCYQVAAGPRPDQSYGSSVITIGGDPGDAATTWTNTSGNGLTDGGPGIYAVEVYVNGKNASSSGYKAGLWAFGVTRLDRSDNPS